MYARMLSDSSIAFLKRLLDTPGPSGFESAPANVWRSEARQFAEVTNDVAGNSLAVVNGDGSPTIMLAGHIDEIGVIITYIDDEGFLYIAGIGGWDPQVLVAQRIRIMGRDGDVFGVIGKKPEALFGVKPLHLAGRHECTPRSQQQVEQQSDARTTGADVKMTG